MAFPYRHVLHDGTYVWREYNHWRRPEYFFWRQPRKPFAGVRNRCRVFSKLNSAAPCLQPVARCIAVSEGGKRQKYRQSYHGCVVIALKIEKPTQKIRLKYSSNKHRECRKKAYGYSYEYSHLRLLLEWPSINILTSLLMSLTDEGSRPGMDLGLRPYWLDLNWPETHLLQQTQSQTTASQEQRKGENCLKNADDTKFCGGNSILYSWHVVLWVQKASNWLTVEVLFKLFEGVRAVISSQARKVVNSLYVTVWKSFDKQLLVGPAGTDLHPFQLQELLENLSFHLVPWKRRILKIGVTDLIFFKMAPTFWGCFEHATLFLELLRWCKASLQGICPLSHSESKSLLEHEAFFRYSPSSARLARPPCKVKY